MAENKKSFLIYCDLIHTMEHLTLEERGIIFTWILEYCNDKNPENPAGLLAAVVEPIKRQLKRDLEKYEERAEKSRLNGKKGGRPKNPKKPTGLNKNLSEPKKPDTVTDTVTDTDTVTEKEKIINNFKEKISFFDALTKNGKLPKDKTQRNDYINLFIEMLDDNFILEKGVQGISSYFNNWCNNEYKKKQDNKPPKKTDYRDLAFN
jgi:hypothetical protein